jgi:predicted Zn-dependent peptidase
MSSRLFQSVREEAGLAYSVYSAADFYRDAGMLSIHLGVSPSRGREALARVRQELEQLAGEGPSEAEVDAVRSQLVGSVRLSNESVSSRMYHVAYEEIYGEGHTTAAEQAAKIEAVTLDQVRACAREMLPPRGFALSAMGPDSSGPIGPDDWPGA